MGRREDHFGRFRGERRRQRDGRPACFAVGEDHVGDIGSLGESRLKNRPERGRGDEELGAGIGEHVGILVARQQRIERDRHDPGADRAEEDDGKIRRVVHRHRDAVLAAQAEPREQAREAAGLKLQLAVGQRAAGFDEDGLVGAPFGDVAIDEVGAGVGDRRSVHPPPRPLPMH
jgi:hypothetical protein